MKRPMQALLSLFFVAALAGCASSIKKYDYPSTTDAGAEIDRIESEMSSAKKAHVDVLSPHRFADAREKLDDAKEALQDKDSNSEILEDLGYAKAHLDKAREVAPRAEAAMPEVIKAREDALSAEAVRLRNADLIDADRDLKKVTADFEDGNPTLSADDRTELQKKYIDVQTGALKASYLGQAKALIETARKMDAKKHAEKTLTSAEAKYQAAEKVIETDRNNTTAIVRAADDATTEAKRAVEITRLAKGIDGETAEEAAIALDAKRNEAARNAAAAERNADRLRTARETIRDKDSEIAAAGAENDQLERERRFNAAFASAQAAFSKDEAEVYRQGDNLVVRLKQVQFPTGRSDLPASSLPVLDKVKDVISEMGAEKVVVEGHTDSVGGRARNVALSEKRADAVAKYFETSDVLPAERIETKGFGYSQPLATNKTKEGRAQNRRVDVVISPMKMATASTGDSMDTSMSSANRRDSAERPTTLQPPATLRPDPIKNSDAKNPPAPPRGWEE